MSIPPKRKLCETGQKVSSREVYALKEKYIEETLRAVVHYLPMYQGQIKRLLEEGYTIVGYIRKSKSKAQDNESRVRLLQSMSNKLQQKSLVRKVYASVSANVNDPLLRRDLVKNDLLEKRALVHYAHPGLRLFAALRVSTFVLHSPQLVRKM